MKVVYDDAFKKYGKIIEGYDFTELLEEMKSTPLPDDVVYVANDDKLSELLVAKELGEAFFGQMPIQTGYCNGHNKGNAYMEYHRCSEVNVAATDMVLELGLITEIKEDFTCDKTKFESFLVPAGTAVELYGNTLHYAPVSANEEGFKCTVLLPKGTNEDLHEKTIKNKEDVILAAKNKWLIKL